MNLPVLHNEYKPIRDAVIDLMDDKPRLEGLEKKVDALDSICVGVLIEVERLKQNQKGE